MRQHFSKRQRFCLKYNLKPYFVDRIESLYFCFKANVNKVSIFPYVYSDYSYSLSLSSEGINKTFPQQYFSCRLGTIVAESSGSNDKS